MEKLYEVDQPSIQLIVYPTSVEITESRGLFGFLSPRKEIIPVENIVSVGASWRDESLLILTADGEDRRYQIGSIEKAKALKELILSLLPVPVQSV